jgi:hypothetical protein
MECCVSNVTQLQNYNPLIKTTLPIEGGTQIRSRCTAKFCDLLLLRVLWDAAMDGEHRAQTVSQVIQVSIAFLIVCQRFVLS